MDPSPWNQNRMGTRSQKQCREKRTAVENPLSEASLVLEATLGVQEGAPVFEAQWWRPRALSWHLIHIHVMVHELK